MSDLISRSALIKILNHRAAEHRENYEDFMGYMGERKTIHYTELKECKSIIDIVDNAPTVEAKPVVHCKDCSHWGIGVAGETEHVKCCEYGKYMVGENGFCCYADMRGEKHD